MSNYKFENYSGAEIESLLDKVAGLDNATTEKDGLMSKEDKSKLNDIESGAEANVIEGVTLGGASLTPSSKIVNIPVDSTPTSGSNNPVKSGGVYSALQELESEIEGRWEMVVVNSLPTAGADTMYKFYLVPSSSDPSTKNEYVTVRSGSAGSYTYSWEQIGTVDIKTLAGQSMLGSGDVVMTISRTSVQNSALVIKNATTQAWKAFIYTNGIEPFMGILTCGVSLELVVLAGSITSFGLAEINNNLCAVLDAISSDSAYRIFTLNGTPPELEIPEESPTITQNLTAQVYYQKPSGGIPASDLAQAVRTSLGKALTAVQPSALEDYAKTDGYYESMAVGIAKNLEGRTVVADSFFGRTAGGDAEVSNGLAQLQEVQGNSIKWNQLANPNVTTSQEEHGITATRSGNGYVLSGTSTGWYCNNVYSNFNSQHHKLFVHCSDWTGAGSSAWAVRNAGDSHNIYEDSIYQQVNDQSATFGFAAAEGYSFSNNEPVRTLVIIDLTAIFGSGNEPATVDDVWEWLESVVGIQDYYPYDAGSVINVNFEGIESIGQNLLDPATGKAQIIGAYSDVYGNYYGIIGTHRTITFTDNLGNSETITPDEDGKFEIETPGVLEVASAGEDCSVFHWWDGSKTDYTAYRKDVAKLDVTHIWGKKDGEGELVCVWPNGMPGIGDDKDVLMVEGENVVAKVLVGIRDYESGDESDSTVLTDGSDTYYVLDTQEVYTDLEYQGSSLFADGTPVALPVNYNVDNWGDEFILPKNSASGVVTAKPKVTCKYSIDAAETLDTHTTEIEDLYDKVSEKPDKVGVYPDMSVGTAKALAGNNALSSEFTFRKTGGSPIGSGLAMIDRVKGKSLVWNQLVENGNFATTDNWSKASADVSINIANNACVITILNNGDSNYRGITQQFTTVVGHKYYISADIARTGNENKIVLSFKRSGAYVGNKTITMENLSGQRVSAIITAITNPSNVLQIGDVRLTNAQVNDTITVKNVNIFDLTLLFGSGNEPTTVEEFEALYPLPYYPYNAGQIINNKAIGLEVVGFNQYNPETGKVSVIKGQTYYVGGTYTSLAYSDGTAITVSSNLFTADRTDEVTVTGGNSTNTIINLSDASRNGTYEAYKKTTLALNLPTLTGKKDGEGESVTICANGLKSNGATFDEGVVENGYLTKIVLRIGSRAYESGDESDSSVTTDGTNTNYNLATPETYILDNQIYVGYTEDANGTERRLPEDTASVVTAPFCADIKYPIDAVKQLQQLPEDYLSKESTQALLSALQTAGVIASYTMTWNASQGKYNFTITKAS